VAKMTGETESTIRYRTKNKLLPITRGKNWYAYYEASSIVLCKKIRQLQNDKRYTLEEIRQILNP
jgi:DNA-binding transcriptional MerR regulator